MSSRSDEILLDRDRRDGGGVRYWHATTPGTLAAASEAQGIGGDYWLRKGARIQYWHSCCSVLPTRGGLLAKGGCKDPLLVLYISFIDSGTQACCCYWLQQGARIHHWQSCCCYDHWQSCCCCGSTRKPWLRKAARIYYWHSCCCFVSTGEDYWLQEGNS